MRSLLLLSHNQKNKLIWQRQSNLSANILVNGFTMKLFSFKQFLQLIKTLLHHWSENFIIAHRSKTLPRIPICFLFKEPLHCDIITCFIIGYYKCTVLYISFFTFPSHIN